MRRPPGVVRLVLSRVFVLVGLGVVVGAGLSWWASTFVAALLYGVEPRDPVTLVGAAGVLTAVGAFAGSPRGVRLGLIQQRCSETAKQGRQAGGAVLDLRTLL